MDIKDTTVPPTAVEFLKPTNGSLAIKNEEILSHRMGDRLAFEQKIADPAETYSLNDAWEWFRVFGAYPPRSMYTRWAADDFSGGFLNNQPVDHLSTDFRQMLISHTSLSRKQEMWLHYRKQSFSPDTRDSEVAFYQWASEVSEVCQEWLNRNNLIYCPERVTSAATASKEKD